jgi:Dirigent-like protein
MGRRRWFIVSSRRALSGKERLMSAMRFAAAASVVALAVMLGASAAGAAPKPQTISLLEGDTAFYATGGWNASSNTPPAVGQGFVTNGVYYKWAGTKRGAAVGHLQVVCTVTTAVTFSSTETTGWFHCDATAFLPGGRIEASGALSFSSNTNTLPIVGGTGQYVAAQGYVTTTNIGGENSNTSADVFHITS